MSVAVSDFSTQPPSDDSEGGRELRSRNETAATVFGREAWTCTAAPRPFLARKRRIHGIRPPFVTGFLSPGLALASYEKIPSSERGSKGGIEGGAPPINR